MRAVQSSSTAVVGESGVWCRSDQFAALRYVSRHLETDAVLLRVEQDQLENASSLLRVTPASGAFGWDGPIHTDPYDWRSPGVRDTPELAQQAAELLLAMRFLHKTLADEAISFAEWTRCSTELESLRESSWELMARFLNLSRERSGPDGMRPRTLRLEQGAAGWIAC